MDDIRKLIGEYHRDVVLVISNARVIDAHKKMLDVTFNPGR